MAKIGKHNSRVREQYERYPYPYLNPEQEASQVYVTEMDMLQKINHYGFSGEQEFKGFRVLVAGGGTGLATLFLAEQLRDFEAEIVHLDLSANSIEIAQQRAAKQGLNNITWLHESLLELPKLEMGSFDYINCTGVLHHLDNPEEGLTSLRAVLKQAGCIGLMVYAKYGRSGVYLVQELMRQINAQGDTHEEKIKNTWALLESLPASNLFRYQETDRDDHKLLGDIGLYDLFLHPVDKPFTVIELRELLQRNGFYLLQYVNPVARKLYQPASFIKDAELLAKIGKLPLAKQEAIAEMLACTIGNHRCYVSLQNKSPASINNVDNIPFYFRFSPAALVGGMQANLGKELAFEHQGLTLRIVADPLAICLLDNIDGQKKVSELIEIPLLTGICSDKETVQMKLADIYSELHQAEILLLRQAQSPALTAI